MEYSLNNCINQYYDFNAEINVRYDIKLNATGLAALFSKKSISILEKNSSRNVWIGFGTFGYVPIEHYDMNLDNDKDLWAIHELKYKKIV